jgi:hypothetical protein
VTLIGPPLGVGLKYGFHDALLMPDQRLTAAISQITVSGHMRVDSSYGRRIMLSRLLSCNEECEIRRLWHARRRLIWCVRH